MISSAVTRSSRHQRNFDSLQVCKNKSQEKEWNEKGRGLSILREHHCSATSPKKKLGRLWEFYKKGMDFPVCLKQ